MAQLIVTANKLNKRSSIPADFSDKSSVIGIVNRGFRFEGEEVADVPNAAPGKWYRDRDHSFYWGGGVKEIAPPALAPVAAAPAVLVPAVDAVVAPLLLAGIQTFQWLLDLKLDAIWNDPAGSKGESVKIAVLDSGYNILNEDLSPFGVGVVGLNPPLKVEDILSPNIKDTDGHGTFCATLLAGRNKRFVIGAAPGSDLLVIKISKDGTFGTDGLDIIFAGIQMAIDNGAEIISISHSLFADDLVDTPNYIETMGKKLDAMVEGKNVLIFAACGNNTPGNVRSSEKYPASFDSCISVGASDNGNLSPITVLSNKTIIHAQGVAISSYLLDAVPVQQSGTSFSTPIVAGIAALAVSKLKRLHGSWDPKVLRPVIEDGDPIPGQGSRRVISPSKIFSNKIFQ